MVRTTDYLLKIGSANCYVYVPLSVLVLVAGIVAILFIRKIDVGYYQKLLLASVHYGVKLEQEDLELKEIMGKECVGLTEHLLSEVPESDAISTIGSIYKACFWALGIVAIAIWVVSVSAS